MLFPTATFALFFALVLPLSWLLVPRPSVWRPFMIAASLVFYGWWNPRFVLLLVAVTIWNWVWGNLIHRAETESSRKAALAVAVIGNLSVLGYFKYANFFLVSIDNTLLRLNLDAAMPVLEITLPIGISFFTFQALSYVIDIKRRVVDPVPFMEFAVYLTFFPHLVAGPIVRAKEFLPQLKRRPDPRHVDLGLAFFLIIFGMFKKVVLSDLLSSRIVDPVFAAPKLHSSLEIWVATYAYAAQIYCDFSGYTDMAIGLALLLGIRFPQNFDGPYTAISVRDFWRRWHMTLSRFLRDYLYIPLGGNRRGRLATYRNLMLTMLIGGLWHGASWTFVAWGGLHGSALCYEHFRDERREAQAAPAPEPSRRRIWIMRLIVFNFVCAGWIFFRSPTFSTAWAMFEGLFNAWGRPSPLVTGTVVLAIVTGIGCQYLPRELVSSARSWFGRLSPVAMGLALGLAIVLIDALGPQGVRPFIYFAF